MMVCTSPTRHASGRRCTHRLPGKPVFALGAALLLGSAALNAQNPPQIKGITSSAAGVNLAPHTYYSPSWVFVDVFKHAAPWWAQSTTSSTWSTGLPLDQDADGWIRSLSPGQAAGTLIYQNTGGRYPGGRYIATYDGDGELQFGFDARIASSQPGRIEIDVSPSDNGIYVKLVRTNPANYLRNLRITEARFENHGSAFHPRFLNTSKVFSVQRFMDWQRTNDSPIRSWGQRTTGTSHTQAGDAGVALEYMIDLCNELGVDGWFCVPHLADDFYVQQFASLLRDRLDPGLRAYIEYSNEVWNSQFVQCGYAQQEGLRRNLSGDPVLAGMRFYAQRSSEIHTICTRVFAGSSRLVRVLASQNANPWIGEQIMDWNNAAQTADALAVAPYFGGFLGNPSTTWTVTGKTVPEVLVDAYLDVTDVMGRAQENADNAAARGLSLIAYEGGQHLVGFGGAQNDPVLTQLFVAANRHPHMGLLQRYFYDKWRQAGGGLMVAYNSTSPYTKWGSWGLTEAMDQDPLRAPKMWAVLDYIFWNPKWW